MAYRGASLLALDAIEDYNIAKNPAPLSISEYVSDLVGFISEELYDDEESREGFRSEVIETIKKRWQ